MSVWRHHRIISLYVIMAFYVSEIKTGAPVEFVNDVQRRTYTTLDNVGVNYCRVESDPGITMEDCENIDRAFGIRTVKTILLTNRQKNKFWLYVTHAHRPFVTKEFCAALQIPRVSFADEELMKSVIGTCHGAATAFGLLLDGGSEVEFVMDREVAERQKVVITDGDPCGFIAIALEDLFRVLGRRPTLID